MQNVGLPDRLVEAVKSRRCVPFVGSGLSKQADPVHFPNWTELLQKMTREGSAHSHISGPEAKSLRALLRKNRHMMAAEALKNRLPRDFYLSFIEAQFDPRDVEPAPIHSLLFELYPRLIITTNYDRLIEDAYAAMARKTMPVIPYSDAAAVQRQLQDE